MARREVIVTVMRRVEMSALDEGTVLLLDMSKDTQMFIKLVVGGEDEVTGAKVVTVTVEDNDWFFEELGEYFVPPIRCSEELLLIDRETAAVKILQEFGRIKRIEVFTP